MADVEQEIKEFREAIRKATDLRTRYQERLKAREDEQTKLLAQMAELNTTPEDIGADIEAINDGVQADLAKARSLLPMDLIAKEG